MIALSSHNMEHVPPREVMLEEMGSNNLHSLLKNLSQKFVIFLIPSLVFLLLEDKQCCTTTVRFATLKL